MLSQTQKAIVRTLLYSDIFDYPLTKDEIWKFLISGKRISKKSFDKIMRKHPSFSFKKGFYYIPGREKIISKRTQRREESKRKLHLAHTIVSYLSFIPTILFIGISGALALENAKKDDDIDLFIITQKNSLWITRFLVLALLQFLGKRRKRGEVDTADKVCCNMFINEENLMFPKDRRDVFTAHEIVQLKPLFDKGNTYIRFMKENKWVEKYMPNAIEIKKLKNKSPNYVITQLLHLFEFFAKRFQLWYMKNHRTKETILDTFLAFHPYDYRSVILNAYKNRLKKYHV